MSTVVPAGSITEWPAGIWMASQSRVSSTEVTFCMALSLIHELSEGNRKKLFPIRCFELKLTHAKTRLATGDRRERGPAAGQTGLRSTQVDTGGGVAKGFGGRSPHPGGAVQRIAGVG